MSDLLHMLGALIAGVVLGPLAAAYAGLPGLLIVMLASGWTAAQYDEHYKRMVKGG